MILVLLDILEFFSIKVRVLLEQGKYWEVKGDRGSSSIALGEELVASGVASFASGKLNESSGEASFTTGSNNTASGSHFFVSGIENIAPSFVETVFGCYGTTYSATSTTFMVPGDRLFVIGNGTNINNRSDALIIYKDGNGTMSGSIAMNSDARLKREVTPLEDGLNSITALQGINYKWNDVKPHDMESLQTGLIAQEVEKIIPELVTENSEGYKSVNYIGLIQHLIEAIKELKKKNEQLKLSSELKNRELEDRLTKLEQAVILLSSAQGD